MGWELALLMLLGIVVTMLLLGVPVAFAFFTANFIGAFIFLGGEAGLVTMGRNSAISITSFALVPVSLFVLMGEILFHSGVAFRAIEAIERVLNRIPGRLSIVTVIGGTVFSALSGSTMANTALLGSSLLPDMLKRGYHPTMAMGPIMAVGGIAALIPPSALAVLFGSIAKISIAALLIGGIIPGLMISIAFIIYIVTHCSIDPSLAPAYDVAKSSRRERWMPVIVYVLPLSGILFSVIGTMLAGWASPSESAAFGVLASIVTAAAYRMLTLEKMIIAIRETAKITVMILFIIVASVTFSQIMGFSGAANGLMESVRGVVDSKLAVVIGMQILLLIMGCFIDQISILLITVPIFLPIAQSMGIDLIWLGILMMVSMEISLITPPFGLLIFVMQGVAPKGTKITQIYAAVVPFLLIELAVLWLFIIYPEITTFLPNLLE